MMKYVPTKTRSFVIFLLSLLLLTQITTVFSMSLMNSDYIGLKRPFMKHSAPQTDSHHANEVRTWLIGAYTNEKQATIDFQEGKPTAATGGHELVSAEITPYVVIPGSLLAVYRFGLQKEQKPPFRFRLYQFYDDPLQNYHCIMTLLRPSTTLESLLKSSNYDLNAIPAEDKVFEELVGCEVGWKKKLRFINLLPWKASKYEGVLICGSCQLQSSRDPSMMITAKDELNLWKRELWVNDRVYSPSGQLLIGNSEGIPYKFQKMIQ